MKRSTEFQTVVPLKTQNFGDETRIDLAWIQTSHGAEFQNLASRDTSHVFYLGEHRPFILATRTHVKNSPSSYLETKICLGRH